MGTSPRFTIEPATWYACEFIGDEFQKDRTSYSPIRVHRIEPLGLGRREFRMAFYHANYPEGVREKSYTLRTIERGRSYILARSISHNPARLLQVYDIDEDWLRTHFSLDASDVGAVEWLNRNA